MATLSEYVGRELGLSNWHVIDQDRINAFAECTGDHQWIHVDVERAKRESPFGGTIAHGKAGARIRMRVTLLSVEDRGKGRLLLRTQNTFEIEGEEKPALTAESLALVS